MVLPASLAAAGSVLASPTAAAPADLWQVHVTDLSILLKLVAHVIGPGQGVENQQQEGQREGEGDAREQQQARAKVPSYYMQQ